MDSEGVKGLMMAKTKQYGHFCPVARSLEVIGEKWSLLIVRDLLRGPQRFTDLQRFLGSITAKWLTLRLRELEAAGIVERDRQVGRREIWYHLTPKGQDLAPVVEGLAVWGIEHALRPPLPGEPVHPAQTTSAVTIFLNRRGIRLSRRATWAVRFEAERVYTIRFDGELWSVQRGESEGDLVVETTPQEWVAYLTATPQGRRNLARSMRIEGAPDRLEEFIATFGWRQPSDSRQPLAVP